MGVFFNLSPWTSELSLSRLHAVYKKDVDVDADANNVDADAIYVDADANYVDADATDYLNAASVLFYEWSHSEWILWLFLFTVDTLKSPFSLTFFLSFPIINVAFLSHNKRYLVVAIFCLTVSPEIIGMVSWTLSNQLINLSHWVLFFGKRVSRPDMTFVVEW